MHEIVVGTSNLAKTQAIRAAVAPLGVRVRGADEFGLSLAVREDGTAQDNARAKSVAYARALGRPVLSVDNTL
jgi:inosine/xanthosine triphosphate pyrophosphatase family protein